MFFVFYLSYKIIDKCYNLLKISYNNYIYFWLKKNNFKIKVC